MFTRVRAMLPSAPRLLLMVAAIFGVTIDAAAATFVVNSPLDAVDAMPGNGVCATVGGMCTLRAAIQEANGLGGSHVITLPAGVYALTIAGRGEASAATGDLNITRDVTITGAGAAATIIDANGLDRAFAASSGGITLNDVTVRNGDPGAGTGGCINISAVNLTLARTVITSCRSDFGGGGIYGLGPSSVTVTDTTISQNSAAGPNGGGGIHLVNGITATMTRVTVAGNSAGFGGGIRVFGSAASPSTVTVTDSVIAHNATGAGGAGGVGVDGAITATLTRVTVTNNSGAAGAGIGFSSSSGTTAVLTLVDCTIGQNVSPTTGGGVYLGGSLGDATANITRTTISGNSAQRGAGVFTFGGRHTLANTTISGNTTTDSGGAIYHAPVTGALVTLVNTTIASNSSAVAGAVHPLAPISVKNTIIANSTGAAPANCSTAASMTDLGHNLEFPGTSCGFGLASDRQADPLLGPLAANGGPTETLALLPGSAAIDAGDDATCLAAPVSGLDQRGVSRFVGAGAYCDIGAFESGGSSTGPFPPTALVVASVVGNLVTLRWAIPNVAGLTGFVLEGGVSPGQVLGSILTGSLAPAFTFSAPSGSFYLRVHALYGAVKSAASNEILVHVNVPVAPSAPANLLGLANGSTLALAWTSTFAGGAPTNVTLNVSGALSGSVPLGATDAFSFAGVPPGTYTFTVTATNTGGSSPPSNPVTLTFPSPCSGAPQPVANFVAYQVGGTVFLSWDPPTTGTAPTGYVLDVTGSFVGSLPMPVKTLSGTVPPGSYTFTVAATNACGSGPATTPLTVVVP